MFCFFSFCLDLAPALFCYVMLCKQSVSKFRVFILQAKQWHYGMNTRWVGFLVCALCCLKGPEVNLSAVSPSYEKYTYFFPTVYLQQMVVRWVSIAKQWFTFTQADLDAPVMTNFCSITVPAHVVKSLFHYYSTLTPQHGEVHTNTRVALSSIPSSNVSFQWCLPRI